MKGSITRQNQYLKRLKNNALVNLKRRNVKNFAFFFENVLFIQKVILNLKTIKNKVYESNCKNND